MTDGFSPAAKLIVAVCTGAVLTAVALDFALAGPGRAVRSRHRSSVATATMLGFLLAFHQIVHHRLGALDAGSPALVAAGVALVAAGALVNIVGRIHLGRNWADQVTVYQGHTLVTGGVFALVRHPLYASLVWMFAGASLVYANPLALAATALIFVPAVAYRARQEETALEREFPDYRAYRQRVGMFFPKVRRF